MSIGTKEVVITAVFRSLAFDTRNVPYSSQPDSTCTLQQRCAHLHVSQPRLKFFDPFLVINEPKEGKVERPSRVEALVGGVVDVLEGGREEQGIGGRRIKEGGKERRRRGEEGTCTCSTLPSRISATA